MLFKEDKMRKTNMIKLKRKFSFSLMELHVVVGIFLIFGGLFLGFLNASEISKKAKKTACIDQLKSIGQANAAYSNANQEWVVPAWNGKSSWYEILSGTNNAGSKIGEGYGIVYKGNARTTGTFVCPEEPIPFSPSFRRGFAFTHYGINAYVAGVKGLKDQRLYGIHKQAAVKDPAKAMFCLDMIRNDASYINQINQIAYRHGTPDPRGLGKYGNPPGRGACNIVYFDGHVGKSTYEELYQISSDYFGIDKGALGDGLDLKSGIAF